MSFGASSAFFGNSGHTGLGTNGFEVSLNYITGIPDPNILTCSNTLKLDFKSLLKRDATTREKSIIDLLTYIKENPSEIDDDLIIITWCQLYAKLSLDDSKKVRSISHQIQSEFVLVLGKKYAKYLKDTVGIWLGGCFDSDRTTARVCKASVNDAFGNNKEKVSNLWKAFINQILNYPYQIFAFESKDTLSDERFVGQDESETKYTRIILSCIHLITQSLIEIESIGLKDETKELLVNILKQENYQSSFLHKDLSVKKASYQAMKILCSSRYAAELMNDKLYNSLTKAMVKGLKIDKKKVNPVLYSGIVVTILDTLVVVTKYNHSFWTSVKKANEKLLDILNIGSVNSEPVYYDILYRLLTILPSDFMSLKDYPSFKPYLECLLKGVENERATQFLVKSWNALLNFVILVLPGISEDDSDKILKDVSRKLLKLIDSPHLLSPVIINSLHNIHELSNDDKDILLDINSAIMEALPGGTIDFEDNDYKIIHESNFLENFIKLLVSNSSDLTQVLIANSIEALDDENTFEDQPVLSFNIVDVYIRSELKEFQDAIHDFMVKILNYITETFNDLPLKLLIDYWNSKLNKTDDINIIVNSIFLKFQELNKVDVLLDSVHQLKGFNPHNAKDLSSYLINHSVTAKPAEGGISSTHDDAIYKFLTVEILQNLYNNAVTEEAFLIFITNCLVHYNNDPMVKFSTENPDFIEKLLNLSCAGNDDNDTASQLSCKLENNLSNKEFYNSYVKGLRSVIQSVNSNHESLVERVSQFHYDILNDLLSTDNISFLEINLAKQPSSTLSVANPLGNAIFMFINSAEENIEIGNKKELFKSLSSASFYAELIKRTPNILQLDDKFIIFLSIMSNIAADFIFLEPSLFEIFEDKLLNIQYLSNSLLLESFKDFNFKQLIDAISNNSSDSLLLEFLLKLLDLENRSIQFYAHRVLKSILSDKVELLTLKTFESIEFSKLSKYPTKLSVALQSSKKFLTAPNLDRLRNSIAADIVNLTSSKDILDFGLKNLVLLNSFIDLDLDYEISQDFVMIAPQRFMMILNNICNWCDSDVAYDKAFNFLRIILMEFVYRYIKSVYYVCDSNYPSDFSTKIFDLGLRLCSETLNLINSEDEISLELLSYTLKTINLMNQYKDQIENWSDCVSEMEDELIEIFFKEVNVQIINQPMVMVDDSLSRLFNNFIPIEKMSSCYDKLYELLKSKNTRVQRIAASLLYKLIPKIQDNLVVEFTLSKKKANEEGSSDIHLPEIILAIVKEAIPQDYLEFEPHYRINQYLWSWYLIMDHFKNITQQMRQDYISELSEELISDFLMFIFKEVDITKLKILEDDKDYIKNYSFDVDETLEPQQETKKILINLLYNIMNCIGGTFAQTWFQSIRDKQLKKAIESFIIKYISPSLINNILLTLSNKNTIEDNEFKININRKNNEIKCLYNIDEQMMEISVALPSNYPLSPITVNGLSRVGVDEKKWKSWIMSAQYVINFQNGTIMDAIKHFRDSVKANFENYDDCAICYSILNAVDHSTPNKVCSTCKHNFHSACLYRWFKSSGSSTCPLCRAKFQFKKHS